MKSIPKSTKLIAEKEDFKTLKVGDLIVLMKWGVFEILELSADATKLKFLPDNKEFKKKPMICWLNDDSLLNVQVKVFEYSHLLTCRKPDGDKEFKDYVNPNSKFEMNFLVEGCVRNVVVD